MTTLVIEGQLVLEDRVAPGRLHVDGPLITGVELDPGVLAGPVIAPGFCDVHVHGYGGHDAMGEPADLDGMARGLLTHGVTSFLPTAVSAPLEGLTAFAERVRAWMPEAPADGAGPLGFNLEGPFVSHERKGAHDPRFLMAPAAAPPAMVEALIPEMRVITIAPELPGALELIALLSDRGVAVCLGHSAADLETSRAGYAAGATSTTHLFNGMSGIDHHHPGLAVAALTDDKVYVELIADGHHVHPALWPIVTRTKPRNRLVLVSDGILLGGTDLHSGVLGGLAVEANGGRCVLAGTDRLAGSLISLDAAVRNLATHRVPLHDAVGAATRNPLDLIGVTDRGRLAAGQRADLVQLGSDLRVQRVMRSGEWRFPNA